MNPYADSDLDALMQGYLDGELDSADEQRLFTALSTDPALQREMRDLRAIRSATVGSVHSFVPPMALTSGLFARLGIPSPEPAAEPTTAATGASTSHTASPLSTASTITSSALPDAMLTGIASAPTAAGWSVARLLAVLRVARIPLVVATAGAVLTTSVILWKDDPDAAGTFPKDASVTTSRSTDSPTPAEDVPTEEEPSAPAADARNETTPNDAARSVAEKESGPATPEQTDRSSGRDLQHERVSDTHAAIPPVPVQEAESVPQPGVIPPSSSVPAPDASEVARLQAMDLPIIATAALQMDTVVVAQIGIPPLITGVRLPRGFTLAFTGLAKSSAPAVDLPSASDPLFNRMSVSVGYQLDASSHIGITFGQEAFPQQFSGREGRLAVRYEQNLLTPWAAAWYRHNFGALLFYDLHPWAEISAGSTREFWPLMRGGVGLAYDLHPLLRLQAGVDLGVLGYRFQDRWFTTRHLGASYGLMFRF